MQTLKAIATSRQSMEAAMANAMAQAELNAQGAIKIEVFPIGMVEENGQFTVKLIVKVIEESDLSEEEREKILGEREYYESNEFKDGEMTQEFDEEATFVGVATTDYEGIAEIIPTLKTKPLEEDSLNPFLIVEKSEVPEMEILAAPEWNNVEEIKRDNKSFKNDSLPQRK